MGVGERVGRAEGEEGGAAILWATALLALPLRNPTTRSLLDRRPEAQRRGVEAPSDGLEGGSRQRTRRS